MQEFTRYLIGDKRTNSAAEKGDVITQEHITKKKNGLLFQLTKSWVCSMKSVPGRGLANALACDPKLTALLSSLK